MTSPNSHALTFVGRAMTQRILESEDFQKNFQEGIIDEVLICPCRIHFMVFSLPPSLAVCPGSLRSLCLVSQSSRASLCPTLAQNSEVLDSMGRADIAGLQNEDGSFAGDEWGEIDTRYALPSASGALFAPSPVTFLGGVLTSCVLVEYKLYQWVRFIHSVACRIQRYSVIMIVRPLLAILASHCSINLLLVR